jgi:hypothetical protein
MEVAGGGFLVGCGVEVGLDALVEYCVEVCDASVAGFVSTSFCTQEDNINDVESIKANTIRSNLFFSISTS